MKNLSLKSVVIYPFKSSIFNNDVFVEHLDKAENFCIRKTKWARTT